MRKKLTYNKVKQSFEKAAYTLLSKEYIDAHTKLNYICFNGHEHSVIWNSWQQGIRCPYCINNNIKLTLEQVKDSFEQEGYTLLSKEYINCKTKLDYVCTKGHKHSIVWGSWQQGTRCPYCAGVCKPTLEKIRESFGQEGYTLLSEKYKNANSKLEYICSKGHKHNITWGHWYSGERCPYCVGVAKPTLDRIKKSFGDENYILLSKEYISAHYKLDYICSQGHSHSITWSNWNNSYRCPTCAIVNRSGINSYNWKGGISFEPYCPIWQDKEYKEDIKLRDGYKCLNPYCDSKKSNDLVIHHIDYNKKNCGPNNLITVCKSCNSKANTDREWHTAWYQTIIYRRYISKTK